jgi:hypothetical protein
MAVPFLTAEVMFNDPVWTDVSAYIRSATIKRGSNRVDSPTIRYEAGQAEIVFDNRDRRFDPTNLAGPYTTSFTPDTGVKRFRCTTEEYYGVGITVDIKSATGQVASIVNVTSKATGTTGSSTVAKPSGTVSGQRMLMFHFADVGTTADMSISGGASWGSPIASGTSGADAFQWEVYSKTAGGAEPATYSITQNSGADGVAICVAIANADAVAAPIIASTNNDNMSLFSTPSTTPAGTNDLEIRACGGTPLGIATVSWSSYDPADGFTEYADRQSSGLYTTAGLFAKSLSGTLVGGGAATRVLPMRPIRLKATWNFTATTNLIQNPSFEVDTTGWVDTNGSGSLRTSDQVAWIGGDSLELSRIATAGSFLYGAKCQGVGSGGATIGQTVTITAYVYVPAASFPKITGYSITAVGVASTFVSGPPVADQWYRLRLTKVLTATLDDVQVQFWTDDTHGDGQVIAYIDGVQAEVRPTPSPYCDGDQPGCSWSGTAHNSNSTRPSSVTFPLFRGFVDSWDVSWTADVDSEVTVPCTDGFKVLGAVDRVAGSAVGANELSGARVTRILNSASWPVADRLIATGSSQMQATTLDGAPLTELFLVADSELGEFYIDGAGIATFRGRTGLLSDTRSTNPQARFGDGGEAAGEIAYHDVTISYDDVQLYNEARVARTGGSQQTSSDATSITDFLIHTFERTDLLLVSDAESLSYAQWIVYISKDPELRFDEIAIRPQKDEDNLFPQVLDREIGDRIKITRRPPGGGSPVTREVFIRGIEYDIKQYEWDVKYSLQSATKVGSFLTLDHPVLGKIGRNALRF